MRSLLLIVPLALAIKGPNEPKKCYEGTWMRHSKRLQSHLVVKEARACLLTLEYLITEHRKYQEIDENNQLVNRTEDICDPTTILGTVSAYEGPTTELDDYAAKNEFVDPTPGEIDVGWEPELDDDDQQAAEASGATTTAGTTEAHSWIPERPYLAPYCRYPRSKSREGDAKHDSSNILECLCYEDYCNSAEGENVMSILIGSCSTPKEERMEMEKDGLSRCRHRIATEVSCLQKTLQNQLAVVERPDVVVLVKDPAAWDDWTKNPSVYNRKTTTRHTRENATSTASSQQQQDKKRKKMTIIITVSVISAMILLAVGLGIAVFCCLKRRKAKKTADEEEGEEEDDGQKEVEEKSEPSTGQPLEEKSAKAMDEGSTQNSFWTGEYNIGLMGDTIKQTTETSKVSVKDEPNEVSASNDLMKPEEEKSDEAKLKDVFKKVKLKAKKSNEDDPSGGLKVGAEFDDSSLGGGGYGGGSQSQGQKQTGKKNGAQKGQSKGKKNTKKSTGKKSKGKKTKKRTKTKKSKKRKSKGKKK